MSITNFPDGASSWGMPLTGGGIPLTYGTVFFCDYDNGNDDNSGRSLDQAFKTLNQAYAACTSNAQDVILMSARSTHQLSSMITWAKNRITVIGLDGGGRAIQQGTKIDLATAAEDAVATLLVTGTRNKFVNLKITNKGTHANSVAAVVGQGDEGTMWQNCTFQKTGDLDETTVSDFENRSDSATFVNCEFGMSTLVHTNASRSLWFKASGATRSKDNRFINCRFVVCTDEAAYVFVEVNDASSLAFSTIFEDCIFDAVLTATGTSLTDAIQSFSGLTDGQMSFIRPAGFNIASFCGAVPDQVELIGTVASDNTTGISILSS